MSYEYTDINEVVISRLERQAGEITRRLSASRIDTRKLEAENAKLKARIVDLEKVLNEAADTLDGCRYSEIPMMKKCRAIANNLNQPDKG